MRNTWELFSKEEVASWPEGHKCCRSCREVLPFTEFHRHKNAMFGYNTVCKTCRVSSSKRQYWETSQEQRLFNAARSRATRLGREFSITISDIVIPTHCPVLGVELKERDGQHSPSLDRINSDKGYIPGNVRVTSYRANMLKNNATVEELRLVLKDLVDLVQDETVIQ